MNQNHKRVLGATLSVVDETLGRVAGLARTTGSPLAKHVLDLSPAQATLVAATIERTRARLGALARELDLDAPHRIAASRAMTVLLESLDDTLYDARPRRLEGYGRLDPGDAARVEAVLHELSAALARIVEQLRRTGRELGPRLARLPPTRSVDRDLLALLDVLVTRHGLVDLRGALEAVVDRLESGTFEVAAFGRVSSGKSSLLNALLGQAVLPVGVTPVTAVSTRIVAGPPGVLVQLADGTQTEVPLAALADYVTEEKNPANMRQVARVTARTESQMLDGGLVLVDTPGVGALATHGARESYAYLPRCDLGLVLIDAAGSPSPDDLELVGLLLGAGIDVRVVVSKVDLLDDADAARLAAYVQHELAASVPVDLVSARAARYDAAAWARDTLLPYLATLRAARETGLARKVDHIARGVERELERALRSTPDDARGDLDRRAAAVLHEAQSRCDLLADAIRTREPSILAQLGARVESDPATAEHAGLAAILDATVEPDRIAIRDTLVGARDALGKLVEEQARRLGVASPELDDLQIDLLAEPRLELSPDVHRPRVEGAKWPARLATLRRHRARMVVEAARPGIESALSSLAQALRIWTRRVLPVLDTRFATLVAPLAPSGVASRDRAQVEADLAALRARPTSG